MSKWFATLIQLLKCASLIFVFILMSSGCSSSKIDPNDPALLFRDAQEEIESEHYLLALEKLRSIRNKFPYSKYAVDAQLRIADVYYLQELYAEAAGSSESFKDLHPTHEKAHYASYR